MKIVSSTFAFLALASQALAGGVTLGKDPAADRRASDTRHFGMHSEADTNRDSAITIEEWGAYKSNSGKQLPEFGTIDLDRNNFISPQEMVQFKNSQSSAAASDNE